jgi:hypothetical protein
MEFSALWSREKFAAEASISLSYLLVAQNVVEYIGSDKFKAQELQVETAMYDNFQGFCNFSRAKSDMGPVLCKAHATGK